MRCSHNFYNNACNTDNRIIRASCSDCWQFAWNNIFTYWNWKESSYGMLVAACHIVFSGIDNFLSLLSRIIICSACSRKN